MAIFGGQSRFYLDTHDDRTSVKWRCCKIREPYFGTKSNGVRRAIANGSRSPLVFTKGRIRTTHFTLPTFFNNHFGQNGNICLAQQFFPTLHPSNTSGTLWVKIAKFIPSVQVAWNETSQRLNQRPYGSFVLSDSCLFFSYLLTISQ